MDADNTIQDENSRESLFFYGDHSFPMGMTADNHWNASGPLGTYTIENGDKMLTGTVSFNTRVADGELDEGWSAGPIQGAFGASYREATIYQKKDNL